MGTKRGEKADPVNDPNRCGHYGVKTRAGALCGQMVIAGTQRCKMHAGKSRLKAKAEGAVVVELRRWGLGDSTVDPGEVLLRLVTQSAARCELYAGLLGEAYDAAERLREAGGGGFDAPTLEEAARQDLDRVFGHGGVAALVGKTYAADKQAGIFATGEAIRGLAKLEAEERDRCATFASKAVAAGLAERQVRLAEKQGGMLAAVILGVLADLGLPADGEQVRRLIGAHIARATGMPAAAIEGGTA